MSIQRFTGCWMPIFQPTSFEASLTLIPFLPIASDNWSLVTMACMVFSFCIDDDDVFDARRAEGGLGVAQGLGDQTMMSIFSPASSLLMARIRLPLTPMQAPTGSTSFPWSRRPLWPVRRAGGRCP